MITTLGGIKGGTGKTTIATNLAIMRAIAGHDVLLIDADEQATASVFTILRDRLMQELNRTAGYTAIRLYGKQVLNDGLKLKAKYEDIIIDTGGRDTGSQRAALAFSDRLLVPVQPRSFDLWSLEGDTGEEQGEGADAKKTTRGTFDVVRLMRPANPDLRVFTFINHGDHRGNDNRDTAQYLAKLAEAEFLDCGVGNRKSFGNAAAQGLGVVELGGVANAKATAEMIALYRRTFDASDEEMLAFDNCVVNRQVFVDAPVAVAA